MPSPYRGPPDSETQIASSRSHAGLTSELTGVGAGAMSAGRTDENNRRLSLSLSFFSIMNENDIIINENDISIMVLGNGNIQSRTHR